MNIPAIQAAMAEARTCAMVMLESASYIKQELPNVQLDEALLSQTEQMCSTLVGTKHDIISDIFELHDVLESPATTQTAADVSSTLERLINWIQNDISEMHALVTAIDAASQRDSAFGLAFMLIAGCATNILNAFNRFTAAVDSLTAEA